MAKKSKMEKTEKKEINKETEVKKSKNTKGAEAVEATPLQNLAKDINKVLGVEPALDVSAKDLGSQIKEIMPEIQSEDKLSKESFATLKELGWAAKPAKKVAAKKEGEAKAPKGEKASKALGAVKTLKEKKTEKAVTILGSRLGSQAEKIDIALLKGKGKTKEELAKETGFSVGRISLHLSHLIGKKKLKIEGEKGKYSATHLKG